MKNHEFNLEKDQHMLIDKSIVKKEIKESKISKEDNIIEIGGGTGILTEELAKKAKKVLCFEIDKRFKENLDSLKRRYGNIEIVFGNALEYSWKGYDKIVSNIPYSLSEPVIIKAIEENISEMVLIVSESFKEAIMSKETKIGFTANLFFEVMPLKFIDKKCFFPVPRVDSWIIKLSKKEKLEKNDKILQDIIKSTGKTKNAIMYSLVKAGKTKNQAREIIAKMSIPEEVLEKSSKKMTGKFLMNLRNHLNNLV